MIIPFYTLLMARGLRPGRDGATRWDSHRDKTRGNTTGNQTGGNNEKMRNVTFILGYMLFYGLCGLFVVIIHIYIQYVYIYIHILYVLSTITFQTFSDSFSRHRSLKETSI